MRFGKRSVAVVSVTLLSVALLVSGCGAKNTATSSAKKSGKKLAPYQIVFAYLNAGPAQKDLPLVEAAIDKITQPKFNATVKLMPINVSDYNSKLHLMLQTGQHLDVVMDGSNNGFSSQVSQGLLTPMNKLMVEYGKGVNATFANDGLTGFLKAGIINGNRYAVPTISSYAGADAFEISKKLADKYHIDVSKIKTVDDMAVALKTIHKQDPSVVPMFLSSSISTIDMGFLEESGYDNLGDNIGVLMMNGNGSNTQPKVVDLYETPYYAKMVNTARSWYLKGYINQDAATTKLQPAEAITSGKAFAYMMSANPNTAAQESSVAGTPIEVAMVAKPVADSASVCPIMLSIPAGSKDPARAMMFMNLLYSDAHLVNLLDWGIEGKDYVKKSATTVDFPPGVTQSTDGYVFPLGFQMGDEFLSYTSVVNQPADLWQQMKKWDESATQSPALGFLFNPGAVKTQYASVTSVIDQYVPELQTGEVDPGKVLPKFIAQLKAAGIDQVIAAKQKQLNAWLKTEK